MPHSIEIEFRDDHVHIQLPAGFEFDPAGSAEVWERLKKLCSEHGTARILVEGYFPGGERTTIEVIEAGQRTAAVPHLWMAFHIENHQQSEASELFETIAASKGVRVKHFADRERALVWLRNNSPN